VFRLGQAKPAGIEKLPSLAVVTLEPPFPMTRGVAVEP
jgi:hypothetical protein